MCGRVGCGEVASCVLLMAPQDTQAWLVSLKHDAAPEGVPLCDMHADRISVPFGWVLTDDRPVAKPRRKRAKKPATAPKSTATPKPANPVAVRPDPVAQIEPELPDERPQPDERPDSAEQEPGVTPDEPALTVVAGHGGSVAAVEPEGDGQRALWSPSAEPEHEPDETTPLLKRAFRVVRDE